MDIQCFKIEKDGKTNQFIKSNNDKSRYLSRKTRYSWATHPVQNMLELLASGMTYKEILDDYEDLEEADLQACLFFASKMVQIKSVSRLVA